MSLLLCYRRAEKGQKDLYLLFCWSNQKGIDVPTLEEGISFTTFSGFYLKLVTKESQGLLRYMDSPVTKFGISQRNHQVVHEFLGIIISAEHYHEFIDTNIIY